jgi:predicted DNA binding CopG/RHH family protein
MDDSELEAALAQYDEPIDDLVQDLLEEFFKGDSEDIGASAIALRRRRLVREKDAMEARKQKLNKSISDIEDEIELLDGIVNDVADEVIDEYLENCKGLPEAKRIPSNDAIKKQAREAGIPRQDFIERLNEKYPREGPKLSIHETDEESEDGEDD